MRTYYVGMDVHRATIAIVALNGAGKVVEQLVGNERDARAQLLKAVTGQSVCDVRGRDAGAVVV